jgi:hypothetical protein
MWDLTVETAHTFFVGTGQWLVHNTCGRVSTPTNETIGRLTPDAESLWPAKAGRIELHHVRPKYLGGDPMGALVSIPAAYHQLITNAFRALAPYGSATTRALTDAEVIRIMDAVYRNFPID